MTRGARPCPREAGAARRAADGPRQGLATAAAPWKRSDLWLAALLVLLPLLAFGAVGRLDFVEYDDQDYVYENPRVLGGLTGESFGWAFTEARRTANWHPLTWLSLMLDRELWGDGPAGFHRTNLALHVANGLLLFLVLRRWTGARWPSALAAALFAVHPLHVESVAWISARKDVLSTLFGLAAIAAYGEWVRRRGLGAYLSALAAYALSLLAKAMFVTLPFLLLLLDVWPLGRLGRASSWRDWTRLLGEKTPFLLLATASSAVTLVAQRAGGAVQSLDALPLDRRLANAVLTCALYLRRTIWPRDLICYYPHPQLPLGAWPVLLSAALVAGITVLVLLRSRRRPYLAVGWLWYLGTLIPVVGLVQVGSQQSADRYTYVPLIGVFVALAWLAASVAERTPARRRAAAALGAVVLVAFAALTRAQTAYWRNTGTLFGHALAVDEENALAHYNLGSNLGRHGRIDEAIAHLKRAIEIEPDNRDAHNNLGTALLEIGKLGDALAHLRRAVELDPRLVAARMNTGNVLVRLGRLPEAIEQFTAALGLDPANPRIRSTLARALQNRGEQLLHRGDREAAERHFQQALVLDPTLAGARPGTSEPAGD